MASADGLAGSGEADAGGAPVRKVGMDDRVGEDPAATAVAPLVGEAAVAADEAKAAKAGAAEAERGARDAKAGAAEAERGARDAKAGAELARDEAAAAATGIHLVDELLLDEDAQRRAAHANSEQPFGVPGKPLNRRSAFRLGFALTLGGLLAIALGKAILIVERELLLLLVAAFLAIGLEPVVAWLVHRGLRRGLAVALIVLISLGLVGGFIAVAVPPITHEASVLIQQAPSYFQQLQNKHSLLGQLNVRFHILDKLRKQATSGLNVNAVGGLLSAGAAVISFGFEIFLVVVLVIYFLIDFWRIKRVFYRLAPRSRRARVGLLGDEILARVGGYVLGNVFTSLVATAAFYIEMRVLDVPYALVLAVLVGVLDLVPLIGSTVAGVLVVLVAWATVGLTAALITLGFLVFYRIFEDYLLSPWILRRTVDVRPLVTIVAVILGGALLGVIGALIAVPVAAAIQLLLAEVVYPREDAA